MMMNRSALIVLLISTISLLVVVSAAASATSRPIGSINHRFHIPRGGSDKRHSSAPSKRRNDADAEDWDGYDDEQEDILDLSSEADDDESIITEEEALLLQKSNDAALTDEDEFIADDEEEEDDYEDSVQQLDGEQIVQADDNKQSVFPEDMEMPVTVDGNKIGNVKPSTEVAVAAVSSPEIVEDLHQVVLDARGTATDDEGSSAFVDRMELADAYDEGESTAGESVAFVDASSANQEEEIPQSDADALVVPQHSPAQSSDAPTSAVVTPEPTTSSTAAVVVAAATISEITVAMKEALKELKYKERDMKVMKPSVAAFVIEKKMRRPLEGLPRNFLVEGAVQTDSDFNKTMLLKRAAVIAVTGTVVFLLGKGELLGMENVVDAIQELPNQIGKLSVATTGWVSNRFNANKNSAPEMPAADIPATTAVPPLTSTDVDGPAHADSSQDHDDHQDLKHSVKPDTKKNQIDTVLDETWLDVLITKVERAIKGLLRMEI